MTRVTGFEAFLEDDDERLVEGVDHVHRGGVVVSALATAFVVVLEHGGVEVPALHLRGALFHGFQGARGEGDGGEAGRAGEALLGARVDAVDAPFIDLERMAAEGGDGIDDEEHAGIVEQVTEPFEGLEGAGGGFGMDDAEGLGLRVVRDGRLQHVHGEDLAPGDIDAVNGHARAFHDIHHAAAEDAVHADDGFIAALEEVRDDAFHACHAGGGDGEGEGVVGLKDFPEHHAGVVHDLDVARVEVTERGRGHGAEDAGGDGARAGAHEDAFGDVHER